MQLRTHSWVALVATSVVDQQLEFALLTKMRKLNRKLEDELFTGYGPLSSLSAKIALAYALELIDSPARSRLDKLRKIRNEFAHSDDMNISFADPTIQKMMAALPKDCTTGETGQYLYIWHLKQIETMLVQTAGEHVRVPGQESARKARRAVRQAVPASPAVPGRAAPST